MHQFQLPINFEIKKCYENMLKNCNIYLVDTNQNGECDSILQKCKFFQETDLGLDCEWGVGWNKNKGTMQSKRSSTIALLQISSKTNIVLIHLHSIHSHSNLIELQKILSNPNILKHGKGVRGDIKKLESIGFTNVNGGCDLPFNHGLKNNCFDRLGIELYKPKRLTCSNWESWPLTQKQILYAAGDAYYSLLLGLLGGKDNKNIINNIGNSNLELKNNLQAPNPNHINCGKRKLSLANDKNDLQKLKRIKRNKERKLKRKEEKKEKIKLKLESNEIIEPDRKVTKSKELHCISCNKIGTKRFCIIPYHFILMNNYQNYQNHQNHQNFNLSHHFDHITVCRECHIKCSTVRGKNVQEYKKLNNINRDAEQQMSPELNDILSRACRNVKTDFVFCENYFKHHIISQLGPNYIFKDEKTKERLLFRIFRSLIRTNRKRKILVKKITDLAIKNIEEYLKFFRINFLKHFDIDIPQFISTDRLNFYLS